MGRTATTKKTTRSVITFHQDPPGDDASLLPIDQEMDLKDYEVLIETYKFLTRHRQRRNKQQHLPSLFHDSLLSSFSSSGHCNSNHGHNNSNSNDVEHESLSTTTTTTTTIVSDKHKWAILTLTEVDAITKRVVRIEPRFFPPNTRVLPACLVGPRLKCLKSLCLDYCNELSSLPSEFLLPNLEELRVDVTSFREPFPSSLGNLKKLRTLVVRGKCSSLDNWSKCGEVDESGILLFPQSLAKLTTIRHLEIHTRNMLQIPAKVLDSWGSSLETLVTTHDLSSSNKTMISHKIISSKDEDSDGFVRVPQSTSCSTDDSSEDDFTHLLESSDDDDDDDFTEETGFSILKHRNLFRDALESQLEVRAFRSIARLQKLRSLKLLFDDSKHRTGIASHRRKTGQNNKGNTSEITTTEDTYSIPLALLAGPLSMSLRELDIGTCIASETPPNSSANRSRIPIEVSWVDILQEFPMLETLRLKDCLCSFSNKTATVDLTAPDEMKVLRMPKLRKLVLDCCPEFAVDEKIARPPIVESSLSQDDDIEIVDPNLYFNDEKDDNESVDGPEKVVFRPHLGGVVHGGNNGEHNDNGNGKFQPAKGEKISRIIHLSGMLVDAIRTPRDEEAEDVIENGGERTMLSNLCTQFLRRCPVLEVVSIRDCKVTSYCEDLLVCLPQNCLRELTLDVLGGINKQDLRAIVEAYPSLVRIHGTCLKGLSNSECSAMHRSMVQRQWQRLQQNNTNNLLGTSLPRPWSILWDKKKEDGSDKENKDDPNSNKHIVSIDRPSSVVKEDGVRLPWPVAALEEKLAALDKTCQESVAALEQKLFSSSNNKRQKSLAAAVGKSLRSTKNQRSN